jgi:hypothetical protein
MAFLNHAPQADDSDLQPYAARRPAGDGLVYDANGKPMISSRTIRNGLVFSAVFYSVVGGAGWLALRFL